MAKKSEIKNISDAFERNEHWNIIEQFLYRVWGYRGGKYQENIAKKKQPQDNSFYNFLELSQEKNYAKKEI